MIKGRRRGIDGRREGGIEGQRGEERDRGEKKKRD